MLQTSIFYLSIIFTFIISSYEVALAQDHSPIKQPLTLEDMVKKKNYIQNAVVFQLFPKGFKYFDNNIYHLISSETGLQIEENTYPPQVIEVKPLKTEDLIGKNPENLKLLQQARNFIARWFSGLTLSNTHKFVIQLGNFSYQTKFTKSSIYLDPSLLKKLNKTSGAVLVLELQAQRLALFSDSIRAKDSLNPIFQTLGVNGLQIQVNNNKKSQQEIRFKVPLFIEIDKDSNLKFSILKFESNIQDLDITYKYKKITTGQYKIITTDEFGKNQHVVEFKSDEINQLLKENQDRLLYELKTQIVDFANNSLVELINTEVQKMDSFNMSFTQPIPMSAPDKYVAPSRYSSGKIGNGTKPIIKTAEEQPFILGLKLNKNFGQNSDRLNFSIDTYIEDLTNPNIPLKDASAKTFTIDETNPYLAQADAALALDLRIFNRILQLTDARKYFQNMNQTSCSGEKSYLTIPEPIQISLASTKPTTRFNSKQKYSAKTYDFVQAKLNLVAPVPHSAKFVLLPDPKTELTEIKFSVEALVRVEPSLCKETYQVLDANNKVVERVKTHESKMCLDVYLDRPLLNTLKIDKSNYRFYTGLFESKIKDEVHTALTEAFKPCPGKSEAPLLESLPLPPELFSMRFDILNLNVDKNGYLVLFMNIKNANE